MLYRWYNNKSKYGTTFSIPIIISLKRKVPKLYVRNTVKILTHLSIQLRLPQRFVSWLSQSTGSHVEVVRRFLVKHNNTLKLCGFLFFFLIWAESHFDLLSRSSNGESVHSLKNHSNNLKASSRENPPQKNRSHRIVDITKTQERREMGFFFVLFFSLSCFAWGPVLSRSVSGQLTFSESFNFSKNRSLERKKKYRQINTIRIRMGGGEGTLTRCDIAVFVTATLIEQGRKYQVELYCIISSSSFFYFFARLFPPSTLGLCLNHFSLSKNKSAKYAQRERIGLNVYLSQPIEWL